jgi:hypothetical protein
MLTNGIAAHLLTQSSITSLVSGGTAIQPAPAPVDLSGYPCITYKMVSDVPEYTLTGIAGLSASRIVFDCLAPYNPGGYLVARNIALAVKAALSGYQGTLPDGTKVYFAEVVNVTDNFDNETLLSRSSVHVMFTYSD